MKKLRIFTLLFVLMFLSVRETHASVNRFWEIQSIDTMKYSRDLAREKLNNKSFERVIERQVKDIAETGATHLAIGTPYDEEFIPYLKTWVNIARNNGLNVWFRGNFSGWESWFDYSLITEEEHTQKVVQFIKENPNLFEDGDIFSSCPECENGVIGDPRSEVDVVTFRKYIISEYLSVKEAFSSIGRDVGSNYYSMNADVAYLVMDEETTKALDGLVTIDHYIKNPDSYSSDITRLASRSGGQIMIGEFGAPIPDIHGRMTEDEQSEWISDALSGMVNDNVVGINYWTHVSSSTSIWSEGGREKPAVDVIVNYYKPRKINLFIEDELGRVAKKATVKIKEKTFTADKDGMVEVLLFSDYQVLNISADSYISQALNSSNLESGQKIILKKEKENIIFKLRKLIKGLIDKY